MTRELQLPKAVKRITILKADPELGNSSLTMFRSDDKKKKKKRQTFRWFEKFARRNTLANQAFTEAYLERHDRSNRKRRDGWLQDIGTNLLRANRKGTKKLKIGRLLTGGF